MEIWHVNLWILNMFNIMTEIEVMLHNPTVGRFGKLQACQVFKATIEFATLAVWQCSHCWECVHMYVCLNIYIFIYLFTFTYT